MELFAPLAKETVLVLLEEASAGFSDQRCLFLRQNHIELCAFAAIACNSQRAVHLIDPFLHAGEPKAAVAIVYFESDPVISKVQTNFPGIKAQARFKACRVSIFECVG